MAWWEKGDWLDTVRVYWRSHMLPGHYRDVFNGEGSPEQCKIVLADLARESGFFATSEDMTPDVAQFYAGKRHMMTYILAKLRFVPRQMQQLGNVVSEHQPERNIQDE